MHKTIGWARQNWVLLDDTAVFVNAVQCVIAISYKFDDMWWPGFFGQASETKIKRIGDFPTLIHLLMRRTNNITHSAENRTVFFDSRSTRIIEPSTRLRQTDVPSLVSTVALIGDSKLTNTATESNSGLKNMNVLSIATATPFLQVWLRVTGKRWSFCKTNWIEHWSITHCGARSFDYGDNRNMRFDIQLRSVLRSNVIHPNAFLERIWRKVEIYQSSVQLNIPIRLTMIRFHVKHWYLLIQSEQTTGEGRG